MENRTPWVLFDADDTLCGCEVAGEIVGTSQAYRYCHNLFGEVMSNLGFDEAEAKNLRMEIDDEQCRRQGFSRRARFPRSFSLAYRAMCLRHSRPASDEVSDSLEQLGWMVVDFPGKALPGAIEVLMRVSSECRVAIVTKGNRDVQFRRIREAGCALYVEKVISMTSKSVDEWRKKVVFGLGIHHEEVSNCWVVGDSIKSDIVPAIELGFNAIHVVPSTSWRFERADYPALSNGSVLKVVKSISEVLEHLPIKRPQT
jgi:putative hydrolase of the HAD superfamily